MLRNLLVTGLSATLMAAFVLAFRTLAPAPSPAQMDGSPSGAGTAQPTAPGTAQPMPRSGTQPGLAQSGTQGERLPMAQQSDQFRFDQAHVEPGANTPWSNGKLPMQPGPAMWPPPPMGMCGRMMRMMMGGMDGMGGQQLQTQGINGTR